MASGIKIGSADNVYVARNLTCVNVITSDRPGRSDTDYENSLIEASSSGIERSDKNLVCLWTQTGEKSLLNKKNSVVVCDKYTEINILIDKSFLDTLRRCNFALDQIPPEELPECLTRFAYKGTKPSTGDYSNAMTAWKLNVDEAVMNKLLSDVLKCIDDETDLNRLRQAVKHAFSLCMKLLGFNRGSLVLIFQHSTEIAVERLLTAYKMDMTDTYFLRVKKMLQEFLPSWLKEKDCSWTVKQCIAAQDGKDDCVLEVFKTFPCFEERSVPASLDGSLPMQLREHYDEQMDHFFAVMRMQLLFHTGKVLENVICRLANKPSEPERVVPSKETTPLSSMEHYSLGSLQPVDSSGQSAYKLEESGESPLALPETLKTNAGSMTDPGYDTGSIEKEHDQKDLPERLQLKQFLTQRREKSGESPQALPETLKANNGSKTDPAYDIGSIEKEHDQKDLPERMQLKQLTQSLKPRSPAVAAFAHHTFSNFGGAGTHQLPVQKMHEQSSMSYPEPLLKEKSRADASGLDTKHKEADQGFRTPYQQTYKMGDKTEQLRTDMKENNSRDDGDKIPRFEQERFCGLSGKQSPEISKDIQWGSDSNTGSETAETPPKDVSHQSQEKHDSRQEASASPKNKKDKQSITTQAEQLINWVNVKSKASQSKDPEIRRLMEQVEHSLQEEETPSPRARSLDTVIVLDTSDSVSRDHLNELKEAVGQFVDGIEENVETMNLEENLAVVQIGDRAWVRQHLTNDYNRVRDAVDGMTPTSKTMTTGGRTPLFQTLLVCLGAIEGRGGVVNVAGCHRVRPRLIFFTDGRPTDEGTETGPDSQSNVNEVKFALVQLVSEFASKKHKTTPVPIFWVPIGNDVDRPFLDSLAALSLGKVVTPDNIDELCRYYKVQETIGCVYKMVRKHKDIYETETQIMSVINALAGNLNEREKKYIVEEVRKKQKEPEHESNDADDFDNIFEDTENVEKGKLPKLGTRVVRGKDWKWNDQDSGGPGTVIQHRKKQDGWLHVMWDNGSHNAYRYCDDEGFDVEITENHPRLLKTELIDIGVQVVRGDDWRSGDEDGRGIGVVIRKRKDGKVKVRWDNGFIGKYRYGADGKMELKVVVPKEAQRAHESEKERSMLRPTPEEELMGAVGGYYPGPVRRIWKWHDHVQGSRGRWRMYDSFTQDKLLAAYNQRNEGTCVIQRDRKNRRLLFQKLEEKTVDRGGGTVQVQTDVVTEDEYQRLLQEEEELNTESH